MCFLTFYEFLRVGAWLTVHRPLDRKPKLLGDPMRGFGQRGSVHRPSETEKKQNNEFTLPECFVGVSDYIFRLLVKEYRKNLPAKQWLWSRSKFSSEGQQMMICTKTTEFLRNEADWFWEVERYVDIFESTENYVFPNILRVFWVGIWWRFTARSTYWSCWCTPWGVGAFTYP